MEAGELTTGETTPEHHGTWPWEIGARAQSRSRNQGRARLGKREQRMDAPPWERTGGHGAACWAPWKRVELNELAAGSSSAMVGSSARQRARRMAGKDRAPQSASSRWGKVRRRAGSRGRAVRKK